MSTGGAAGSREVGTNRIPPTIASAAIGTLTKKIEPQEKCASSQPPVIGPAATPTPTMAAQRPIALARRTGSVKMLVINPNVVGKITAAPTPIAARAPIRAPAECTCAATADVTAKAINPALSQPLLPYRSLRLPADSSNPDMTRVYASTIHCSCAVSASSSRDSVGSATLTIVASTLMTKTLRQMTASAGIGWFRNTGPLGMDKTLKR